MLGCVASRAPTLQVLAHVLLSLRDRRGGAAVCAVHIDYANRAESAAEAAFLQRWCARLPRWQHTDTRACACV
eukprot:6186351-Pleurochrysis_carterae.AAC.3